MLQRISEHDREPIQLFLDGRPVGALRGDTVLTAILTNAQRVRTSEFGAEPRSGFCFMGACQDCWVWTDSGERLRACTTFAEPGMRLVTSVPA